MLEIFGSKGRKISVYTHCKLYSSLRQQTQILYSFFIVSREICIQAATRPLFSTKCLLLRFERFVCKLQSVSAQQVKAVGE